MVHSNTIELAIYGFHDSALETVTLKEQRKKHFIQPEYLKFILKGVEEFYRSLC